MNIYYLHPHRMNILFWMYVRRFQNSSRLRFPAVSIDSAAKLCIVLSLVAIFLGYWARSEQIDRLVENLRANRFGYIYLLTGQIFLGLTIAVFLWQLCLVFRYRPAPACADEQLPACTVIVPAYNEGSGVFDTLRSVLASDYPADKLQIIAIDDGSVDDTWRWIEKAARESGGRIETIRFIKNRGKRTVLYEGFIRSKNEVVITIDSDSIIEPVTLRRLVSPFALDQRTGAVAGNVRVLNTNEGIIPNMLDVSFNYSFDFIRAGQSVINTVLCTPGALAAYRRTALMAVVDKWMSQTFLGLPADIGEDRALTNWILRTGHHVKFQSDAIVYTKVPVRYDGLCRMFLRWARSNVRETLMMGQFIFAKFRQTSSLGARINFLVSLNNLVFPRILLLVLLLIILSEPSALLCQVLAGTSIAACVSAIFYAVRHRSSNALWAYAYGIFWVVALSWITPYALVTARNGKWLTREIRDRKPEQPADEVFGNRAVA